MNVILKEEDATTTPTVRELVLRAATPHGATEPTLTTALDVIARLIERLCQSSSRLFAKDLETVLYVPPGTLSFISESDTLREVRDAPPRFHKGTDGPLFAFDRLGVVGETGGATLREILREAWSELPDHLFAPGASMLARAYRANLLTVDGLNAMLAPSGVHVRFMGDLATSSSDDVRAPDHRHRPLNVPADRRDMIDRAIEKDTGESIAAGAVDVRAPVPLPPSFGGGKTALILFPTEVEPYFDAYTRAYGKPGGLVIPIDDLSKWLPLTTAEMKDALRRHGKAGWEAATADPADATGDLSSRVNALEGKIDSEAQRDKAVAEDVMSGGWEEAAGLRDRADALAREAGALMVRCRASVISALRWARADALAEETEELVRRLDNATAAYQTFAHRNSADVCGFGPIKDPVFAHKVASGIVDEVKRDVESVGLREKADAIVEAVMRVGEATHTLLRTGHPAQGNEQSGNAEDIENALAQLRAATDRYMKFRDRGTRASDPAVTKVGDQKQAPDGGYGRENVEIRSEEVHAEMGVEIRDTLRGVLRALGYPPFAHTHEDLQKAQGHLWSLCLAARRSAHRRVPTKKNMTDVVYAILARFGVRPLSVNKGWAGALDDLRVFYDVGLPANQVAGE